LEVEMSKGKKVTGSEPAELLRERQSSSERMTLWCEPRGINWYSLSAYNGWLTTRWTPGVAFAEVVMASAPEALGRYRVEVGDVVVEVDDHFRSDTLRRLVQVLATC
jgi:hypothetical protein